MTITVSTKVIVGKEIARSGKSVNHDQFRLLGIDTLPQSLPRKRTPPK